jgi:hypothetical protein
MRSQVDEPASQGSAHQSRPGKGCGSEENAVKARTAWLWIALGAAAAGLHAALGRDSVFVERFFSRGLFVAWRWIWDSTLGRSPVPWLYIVAASALIASAVKLARVFSRPRKRIRTPGPKGIGRALLRTAARAGALVFLFYVLWGFNYGRVGLEKQLGLEPPRLDAAALAAEASWASRMAAESRASVPGATGEVLARSFLPASLETALRKALVSVLREAGYPAPGRVRVRPFIPGGWMMRFSGTGIYIPYFGEGYAADNLLPFEKPFTLAHEMAHGYGITDEGAANFLAFRACAASSVPIARYSGYASYWSYAAGELPRDGFKALWTELPVGMKADLLAAQRNAAQYRGALDKISRKVYTRYLKSQGIEDGLRSYSRFVGLVTAWKNRPPR